MICRLCLKDITEVIYIFDSIGHELNVANVLGKYFWFEPKDDDPISTVICNSCWIQVSNFHEFYLSVEEAHRLLTERFSIKTERRGRTKRRQSVEDGVLSEAVSKLEPTEELAEIEDLQFNVLIRGHSNGRTEDAAITLSSEVEQDKTISAGDLDDKIDDEKFCDNDESFDGETFMERILDDGPASYQREEKSQQENVEKEPVQRELRRSTRTSTKSVTKLNENSFNKVPVQRRRGRPRKPGTSLPTVDIMEKKKSKISNKSSADLEDVDAQIAQYMSLSCDLCGTVTPTFATLRRHMMQTHNHKGYAVCCNKKFRKRTFLMDHIRKHLNPDCYKCEQCDKIFADRQCMRNHFLLKHQPDEVKIYECRHCAKRFAKPYLLEQHRIKHDAPTHICNLCQKGFPSSSLLSSHMKSLHGNYGIMCDICAKVIRGRAAFRRHQMEHEGVALPKVQCDKCGSWHKDKYSLQKHKRRHNETGQLHVCEICSKVAPNRSALLSHQRYVHSRERNFECSVCKKAFKKALSLKEHMTMHTGEVLYRCPHCPKTFNSNANMHSHRKKMHPKEFEERRAIRRENASKAHSITPISALANAKASVAGASEETLLTIKTAEEIKAHDILVTTDEFSDSEASTTSGSKNIIFTIN